MTAYVVDASVVIQRFIKDTYTPQAKVLFSGLEDSSDELWTPEFCLAECANVVWKEVRFRGLPKDHAAQLVTDLVALPFSVLPVSMLLADALSIGLAHDMAIYDAVYIALAKELGLPLITVDLKQGAVALASGVKTKPITDFQPTP